MFFDIKFDEPYTYLLDNHWIFPGYVSAKLCPMTTLKKQDVA